MSENVSKMIIFCHDRRCARQKILLGINKFSLKVQFRFKKEKNHIVAIQLCLSPTAFGKVTIGATAIICMIYRPLVCDKYYTKTFQTPS